MGGAYGTCGGEEDACRPLWVTLREMDYLEGIGVDRRIIFKWLLKKYGEDVD
jgi:hypothetical protein